MHAFMTSAVGTILASLVIGPSLPAGQSPTHPSSPSILFSQMIESNPKPPFLQGPTQPMEQNPKPYIEQNPRPPIAKDPTPPIEQNPNPPTEKQSK